MGMLFSIIVMLRVIVTYSPVPNSVNGADIEAFANSRR